MELDPYRVLGVSYSAELPEIREKFKKLVLKVHPDRGGNPKTFQIVKNAYQYLYKYKTNEAKQLANEKRELKKVKQERKQQSKKMKKAYKRINKLQKINANSNNFNNNQFNKLFNEFKTTDADDRGYEVAKSSKERLDASDIQKKYGEAKKMQIVVIEEPEPMELGNGNYKKLGVKHVKDFSKTHNGGQGFTDIQQAYTNRDVLEHTMGNSRSESHLSNSKSQMSRLQQDRANVNYQMNPEEQMRHDMKMQQQTAMEEKRRHRFSRQTQIAERQFQRMQNYITFR